MHDSFWRFSYGKREGGAEFYVLSSAKTSKERQRKKHALKKIFFFLPPFFLKIDYKQDAISSSCNE